MKTKFAVLQDVAENGMLMWLQEKQKEKLVQNRHKGMWRHESQVWLLMRAIEKIGDLSRALKMKREDDAMIAAADVANFVAMACETKKP